ncbi:MAG: L,D-transpeptidase family protein [candidate division Zixibacteria bacterium]|nr:L,D-transpeptidase family protein [candidate division Zixibacteria bacterium]
MKQVAIGLAVVLGWCLAGCQEQPISTLQRARSALERAAGVGALRYAEADYRRAEAVFQEGQLEIARQKGRLAPWRDYTIADSLLRTAFESADKAARDAQSRIHDLQYRVQSEQENLRRDLAMWREGLDGSLRVYNAEKYWGSAELALRTSERLFAQAEYTAAIESIFDAREWLSRMSRVLTEYANDEASGLKLWRRWVQETVDESRRSGGTAIIVNKTAHKLYLLQGGKVIRTYDCELGYNSARQKYFSGDGATPEGKYHVTQARHRGSRYYKALMINYPNERDRQIFAQNKSRGVISKRARIGGLIEIHGEGGRNDDWTEGCIALTNREMDQIMQYATVGTPVTIVRRSDRWP